MHGLILGGIATALQDRLQPPRHRLHQVPQVLGVIHLEGPEPQDFHLQQREFSDIDSWSLMALRGTPAFLNSIADLFSSVVKLFPPMLCV